MRISGGQVNRGYIDRSDAGQVLAAALSDYRGTPGLLVVGLARGGVPVAAEVARALDAPLDVMVVRKLGAPGREELALGAITRTRVVMNDALVRSLGIDQQVLDEVTDREHSELERREHLYRDGRAPIPMADKTVILVDDGIATGASMRVAAEDARAQGAARLVIAVPTGPTDAEHEFARTADDFVCPYRPAGFIAVGQAYRDFSQTSDAEVRTALADT